MSRCYCCRTWVSEWQNPGAPQELSDLLAMTQRGYFVPPRPEKNVVEGQRMTKDFIEARRAALEKFLMKLASHPVISQSAVSWLPVSLSYVPCSHEAATLPCAS